MKKILSMMMVLMLVLLLAACGGKTADEPVLNDEVKTEADSSGEETKTSKVSYDKNDLNSILTAMEQEYEDASGFITDESVVVFEKIGETYDSYEKNTSKVTNFYKKSLKEAIGLYESLQSISSDYFMCVAKNGLEDYDAWYDAMDDFYDTWNDGMDNFYDIWDDIYEDLYDKCDELVESGEEQLSYSEYSDVWSDMYEEYSDSWSDMYQQHSDAWNCTYKDYSAVWSGFYNDNSNVEELLKEAKGEKQEETSSKTEESTTNDTEKEKDSDSNTELVDGMRPEFKAAMDSYEAFYDEYCEFMKKYKANPTDTKLLTEYSDMMKKLVDMDEAFTEWENSDLNSEELKYYSEVSSRIAQKLLDAAA